MNKRIFIIYFLMFFISLKGFAGITVQNNISDSLLSELKKSKQDTNKVILLIDIGYMLEPGNLDTALYFYNKALKISKEIESENFEAKSLRYIGIVNWLKGYYDIALSYYQKALIIEKKLSNKQGISNCYNNIGSVYWNKGSYEQAIKYYQRSLKIDEKLGDKKGVSDCYICIGAVHSDQKNFDISVSYYQKALKIKEELNDKSGMAMCYNNIGIIYMYQEEFETAAKYYQKSLVIRFEIGDKAGISASYSNIGNVYQKVGNYELSIDYYKKSMQISNDLGNKKEKCITLNNLANTYKYLALAVKEGNHSGILTLDNPGKHGSKELYKISIKYSERAIEIAKEINALPNMYTSYENLYKVYKDLESYGKAFEYSEEFITVQALLFDKEKIKAIQEMETKYQTEKKQLEIVRLEKQKEFDNEIIARKSAENKKQRILIFSAIAGFIMILIFSIILLRMFRQKRKANILLSEQKEEIIEKNEELNQQNEEIISQRDEIETQRDVVVGQKEQLEYIHNELTKSIDYAENIQTALLPAPSFIDNILDEYFVLYKPRDIVSGDFYWINKIDEKIIIIAADCTGHGVPGAFMSMLGISFLNDIINKQKILQPGEILNSLRNNIISSLRQKENNDIGENETRVMVKDGLDMSVCVFDSRTNIVLFAGANNPLYYVQNNEINIVKGDKMPVSIYYRLDNFKTHKIQLNKGDSFYLFTDGFADQFGGEMEKKFNYKRFRKLLLSVNSYKMSEQREQLSSTIEDWKGNTDQIDDILVLGIKI